MIEPLYRIPDDNSPARSENSIGIWRIRDAKYGENAWLFNTERTCSALSSVSNNRHVTRTSFKYYASHFHSQILSKQTDSRGR